MEHFHSKREKTVSIAAAIVAVAALIVSIWQGIAQREHDRLSVRPALRLDKIFNTNDKLLEIHLRNAGTGPALVTQFAVFVDNQPVLKQPGDVWENAEKTLGLFNRHLQLCRFYYDVGDAIPTDETICIIGISEEAYEKLSDADTELVSRALERIKIKIDYTSVYKEETLKVEYPH